MVNDVPSVGVSVMVGSGLGTQPVSPIIPLPAAAPLKTNVQTGQPQDDGHSTTSGAMRKGGRWLLNEGRGTALFLGLVVLGLTLVV